MWYPNICKKFGNVIFKYHASPETMDAFFIISLCRKSNFDGLEASINILHFPASSDQRLSGSTNVGLFFFYILLHEFTYEYDPS